MYINSNDDVFHIDNHLIICMKWLQQVPYCIFIPAPPLQFTYRLQGSTATNETLYN